MAWRLITVTQRLATRLGDLRYRRCGRKLGAEKRSDITSPENIAAERITAVRDASKTLAPKEWICTDVTSRYSLPVPPSSFHLFHHLRNIVQ